MLLRLCAETLDVYGSWFLERAVPETTRFVTTLSGRNRTPVRAALGMSEE
jgi:hypothetical protein